MSMRELERRDTEALVSTGDPAHLAPLDSEGLTRNESAGSDPSGVVAGRGELARAWASLGPFEWVALGYLLLSSAMIFAFSKNLFHPWKLIGAQAIVAAFIFLLCGVAARSAQRAQAEGVGRTQHEGVKLATRFWHFWRFWYPHLFFLFCFEELAYLVHLVNPNWQDAKLIAFDHWMFGVHPAVWLEQFATPLRNEFIQLAYLTYFVYLLVLGGILNHEAPAVLRSYGPRLRCLGVRRDRGWSTLVMAR